VYNYDYVLDHIFHLNGAIELRGSTSGYLQSTFWYAQLELYLAFCVLCVLCPLVRTIYVRALSEF
jgi:hypothetical protein